MNTEKTGYIRIKEILGENGQKAIEKLKSISPDFANYILTFAYADLYTRKGLSDKERELIAVSSLISQKIDGLPLESHIQGMLNVGWKQKEIIETIIFLSGYIGFPSTVNALISAQKVFDSVKSQSQKD